MFTAHKSIACLPVACLAVALSVLPAAAGDESPHAPDARTIMREGTTEIGLMGGYWQAFDPWGDAISTDRAAIMVLPRFGRVISRTFDASILSGNVELLLEPFYARWIRPFDADAYGGTLGLKYNFVSLGRWMPFWDIGIGGMWMEELSRLPEQSLRWSFVLQTGPGLQYFMSRNSAFTVGVRWQHFSNAGLGDRNRGLNGLLPYAGISFFF